jgi:acyl-CoA hydrolase
MAQNLADTKIQHFLDLGIAPYTDEKFNEKFRHHALFIRSNIKSTIKEGRIL